jgi:hypothetical protein
MHASSAQERSCVCCMPYVSGEGCWPSYRIRNACMHQLGSASSSITACVTHGPARAWFPAMSPRLATPIPLHADPALHQKKKKRPCSWCLLAHHGPITRVDSSTGLQVHCTSRNMQAELHPALPSQNPCTPMYVRCRCGMDAVDDVSPISPSISSVRPARARSINSRS